MNKHLNEGQLRAALDGELESDELKHLESCAQCQSRQSVLAAQVQKIAARFDFLSTENESGLSAAAAWKKFDQEKLTQKEPSMFRKFFAFPLVKYGVPALLVFALIMAFPGARALASELLNLFRVQQVTVVPVDFTGLEQLDGVVGRDISQLMSDSVTISKEPGDPVHVTNVSEASQLAGFNVRTPEGMTPSRISVMTGAAFSITIDRAKAQALLDEAGRTDLILPPEVDGAEVSVNIPSSVSVAFGTCPEPSKDVNDSEAEREGYPGRIYSDCVILAQIPSPEVSAPASLDVAQLAQIGLEFSGMTPEEAEEFTSTVDWTSTLVVPIPRNASTYEQIIVDGVTGTLIQRPSGDAPQFALLWVKDGIIYTIGGLGDRSQQAIEIANSLP